MNIKTSTIDNILSKYPYTIDVFDKYNIDVITYGANTIEQMLERQGNQFLEEYMITADLLFTELNDYIELMNIYIDNNDKVNSVTLTIMPGNDKHGNREKFEKVELNPGSILSVVGPTGSGKSRLLADIEWAANEDTPTNRKILVNGKPVDVKERFNVANKLVAQLSQNMNFVMDLTVYEFLDLHATSRLINNKEDVIKTIFDKAIYLAGEPFTLDTPVTSLSGGQSRALMISDTAYLSKSPIILIDEIENAGIDRRKALELLVSNDKVVIISTHDPILALMSNERITINNGAIVNIVKTTEEERALLSELEKIDRVMQQYRQDLRYGKKLIKKEM